MQPCSAGYESREMEKYLVRVRVKVRVRVRVRVRLLGLGLGLGCWGSGWVVWIRAG